MAAKKVFFTALKAVKEAKETRLWKSVSFQISEREVWEAADADSNIGNGVEYHLIADMESSRQRLEKAENELAAAKAVARAAAKAVRECERKKDVCNLPPAPSPVG